MEKTIQDQENRRGPEIDAFIEEINRVKDSGIPIFWVGDFNEPSYLDWTQAAKDAGIFPEVVKWPASKKIEEAGLIDSWRQLFSEIDRPGHTWSPHSKKAETDAGQIINEPEDRIDIIYYYPNENNVELLDAKITSRTVEPIRPPQFTTIDIKLEDFPSDHRTVTAYFKITVPDGSATLTFAGLNHNVALDPSYGNRLLTTPNISVNYDTSSSSTTWESYDGNNDSSKPNGWEFGVAQLQNGGYFDVTFTPDNNFGVLLNSFDLVDYINYAGGHTVKWSLLDRDKNLILFSDTVILNPDERKTIFTRMTEACNNALTLRFNHVSGNQTDLAVDNIVFHQVSSRT